MAAKVIQGFLLAINIICFIAAVSLEDDFSIAVTLVMLIVTFVCALKTWFD